MRSETIPAPSLVGSTCPVVARRAKREAQTFEPLNLEPSTGSDKSTQVDPCQDQHGPKELDKIELFVEKNDAHQCGHYGHEKLKTGGFDGADVFYSSYPEYMSQVVADEADEKQTSPALQRDIREDHMSRLPRGDRQHEEKTEKGCEGSGFQGTVLLQERPR